MLIEQWPRGAGSIRLAAVETDQHSVPYQ